MNTVTQPTETSKKRLIVAGSLLTVIVVALGLYQFVYKPNNERSQMISQVNEENAATVRREKEKEPVVITDDNVLTDLQEDQAQLPGDSSTSSATIDRSGESTNLDRPEIKPAVIAVLAVYQDFLAKLKAAPADQVQAVADQYYADRASIFSPTFNYGSSSYSLHLFPQSASVALPGSVSVNSAIIDPDDATQTIVQIFMPPDTSWSILVVVKMNSDDTLKTIEKVLIRNNQLPL